MVVYSIAGPSVDGNNDGIPDFSQPDVITVPGFLASTQLTVVATSGYATVSSAAWTTQSSSKATLASGASANVEFPMGSFKLTASSVNNAER